MKKLICAGLVAVSLIGCSSDPNNKSYQLTNEEKELCEELKIDPALIKMIRAFSQSEITSYRHSNAPDSVSIELKLKSVEIESDWENSDLIVLKNREQFNKNGYTIFMSELNYGLGGPDYVAITNTTDPLKVIKAAGTDAPGYGIDNDSVIAALSPLITKYDLKLIGAGNDFVEFYIPKAPADWEELANKVYTVCPDAVDQGTGNVDELIEDMKERQRVQFFWWD